MSNRAQEIIKTFYEEEAKRQESEVTFTDFTVRLNSSDLAMLEVIAKRFGKAADRIASEATSAALYSMVEALETSERKTLAKEADELNETLAKKAAKANGKPDFDEKSVTWVMNDRAITREENKRKKEQEEKKPAEPVSASDANQNQTEEAPEEPSYADKSADNDASAMHNQSASDESSTPASMFSS